MREPREERERIRKKRPCQLCRRGVRVIDYKDVAMLRDWLSNKASISPRRRTGNCAKHQRMLARAVKNAREMALIPFTADHALAWTERSGSQYRDHDERRGRRRDRES